MKHPLAGLTNGDTMADCACTNLRRAARAMTQMYDDALRPSGMRSTQFSLLAVIAESGTASISDLAERAVIDRTTLTRNLALLEKEGLVRIQEGEDARVRMVSLTARAEPRMAEAAGYWVKAQAQVRKSLGEGRLKHLLGELSGAISAAQDR